MNPDGFFRCTHCHHVVKASSEELERAEAAGAGHLVDWPCPRCHRLAVEWRLPSVRKERVEVFVSREDGLAKIREIREKLNVEKTA